MCIFGCPKRWKRNFNVEIPRHVYKHRKERERDSIVRFHKYSLFHVKYSEFKILDIAWGAPFEDADNGEKCCLESLSFIEIIHYLWKIYEWYFLSLALLDEKCQFIYKCSAHSSCVWRERIFELVNRTKKFRWTSVLNLIPCSFARLM